MAEKKLTKTIIIPSEHNKGEREVIGQEIIDFIVRRTGDGLDVNNRPFAGYRPSYDKPGIVDLEETGQMLGGLSVVSHGPGYITIGFEGQAANDKAVWIQEPTGQKAGKQPPREFLGISAKDLNRILKSFE